MTTETKTRMALLGGPALGAILFALVVASGLSTDAAWTAAITAVCAERCGPCRQRLLCRAALFSAFFLRSLPSSGCTYALELSVAPCEDD